MTLDPLGKYNFKIDNYITDFQKKLPISTLGIFLLQAASKHAEERKFGYYDLITKNQAWVLSRLALEIYTYPTNNNIIKIKTWVTGINKWFTNRSFSFEDEKGEEIGFAKSLWASIDIQTKKPTIIKNNTNFSQYIYTQQNCPIEDCAKIVYSESNNEIIGNLKIRYGDIDINQHLNSIKCIEHLINTFDLKFFIKKEIKRLDINYLSEGLYGNDFHIFQKRESESTFLMSLKNEKSKLCNARIYWK